jgi:predicted lipid-binding transport protein (Tim44 family)
MPLSEHEQRLLDEMERNLYGRDADVVSASGAGLRPNHRALTLGSVLAVVGVGVMVTAVMMQIIVLGVIGFVITFSGALVASRRAASPNSASGASTKSSKPAASGRSTFMDRMQQKWDERQDGQS